MIIVEIPSSADQYQNGIDFFENKIQELEYHAAKPQYDIIDGKVVGNHQGAHFFTVGQRKGLAVGGTKEPLFVLETDVKDNVIYTGQGKSHPGLFRRTLFVKEEELHWVREDLALKLDGTMTSFG